MTRRVMTVIVAAAPAGNMNAIPDVRWCVRHRDGWCAVDRDEEPAEGSWTVGTVCGYGVTLPFGYDRREPDCHNCRVLLGPGEDGER